MTKDQFILKLLDDCRKARSKHATRELIAESIRLDKLVTRLIQANECNPVVRGTTIFHLDYETNDLVIMHASTPQMLTLPPDMAEGITDDPEEPR
jgi:hypothetical protein